MSDVELKKSDLTHAEVLILGYPQNPPCNCRACRHYRISRESGAAYANWDPKYCARYNPGCW